MLQRLDHRFIGFAIATAMIAGCVGSETGSTAQAVTRGAAYTTFDATQGGCDPGSPNGINCNHYACETDVYLTGGPNRSHGANTLGDGTYYFAILAPGHQNGGAADGAVGNLSDNVAHGGTDLGSGDTIADRTFTMSDGVLTNGGSHVNGTSPNGQPIIQAAPFDMTPNPGGVYILAICPVGSSDPADCKYDAFKTTFCNPPPECQPECNDWDTNCTPCPPQCDVNCTDSSCGCTPCPQQCDPSCPLSSWGDCTPCVT